MAEPLSLQRVLELHPWPAAFRDEPRVEFLWHFDLAASVRDLWPLVADTSRMNRALGLAPMKFEERDGKRWGSSTNGGVFHEWVEHPWDWVAHQWIRSVRVYERGFAKCVYGVYSVEPRDDGSRLSIYFGAVPRNLVGRLALRYGLGAIEQAYRRVLPQVAVKKPVARAPIMTFAAPTLSAEAEARLTATSAKLKTRGLDAQAVDKLFAWVRTGDNQDLFRIQAKERARAFGVDEDALLRVFLHATREGLFELSWDSVCPHCRGPAETTATLGSVGARAECASCDIDFGTDEADAVEITFHLHPSVRDVPRMLFCSAEPAQKEHIAVQCAVEPGARLAVALKLEGPRYRVRLQGQRAYAYLDLAGGGPAELTWRASEVLGVRTAAPNATLHFVNDTDQPQTLVVEAEQWSDRALRPGRLFSFQDFRDLFSEEYLSADVQMAIGEQTILFTDIVGSTAMYVERGDPSAFAEVKRHFTEAFAIVAKHNGAVVKTIGDAIMAAFNRSLDAVKASQALHQCFHPQRTDAPKLRVSLNTGSCIAVKLNTGVDYFGHTVNIAAKLQALAESWQVSMSDVTFNAPGVAAWLAEQGGVVEDVAYTAKALKAPIRAKRWSVFPSP